MRKQYYIIGSVIVAIVAILVFIWLSNNSSAKNDNDSNLSNGNSGDTGNKVWSKDEFLVDDNKDSNIDYIAAEVDVKTDSITVLVNKEYPLDESYIPSDLVIPNVGFSFDYSDEKRYLRKEAAENLEKMFAAADYYGCKLFATSGYRSFSRQTMLYNYNLINKGYDYTNIYSAQPGRSEHQTGLSMDITSPSVNKKLTDEFGNTEEGKWVKENCYKYGFIIRYPEGKESITGYGYEPWHVRYVGFDLAKFLYDNDMTLDEYYGYNINNSVIDREQMAYYDKLLTSSGVGSVNNVTAAELDDIVDEGNVDTGILETMKPYTSLRPTGTPYPTAKPVTSTAPVRTNTNHNTRKPSASANITTTSASKTTTPPKTVEPTLRVTPTPEPVVPQPTDEPEQEIPDQETSEE